MSPVCSGKVGWDIIVEYDGNGRLSGGKGKEKARNLHVAVAREMRGL